MIISLLSLWNLPSPCVSSLFPFFTSHITDYIKLLSVVWLTESVWMLESFLWHFATEHIKWCWECFGLNSRGSDNKPMLWKITWIESRGPFLGLFSFCSRRVLFWKQYHESFFFLCVLTFVPIFQMRRYEEAIELCEQTLGSAERNSLPIDHHEYVNLDGSNLSKYFYFRVWRCRITLKSHFQLGRLEDGLASLEKQEEKLSTTYM